MRGSKPPVYDNMNGLNKEIKNAAIITLFKELYEEIKHGDEEHQKWLKDKIEDFIKRRVV